MMREASTEEPEGLGREGEESRRVMRAEAKCGRVRRERVVERPNSPAPIMRMWLGALVVVGEVLGGGARVGSGEAEGGAVMVDVCEF